MKAMAALIGLLVLFAFLAGCAQEPPAGGETTPTPGEGDTGLTGTEQSQELDDFESGMIAEDDEVEIGDII